MKKANTKSKREIVLSAKPTGGKSKRAKSAAKGEAKGGDPGRSAMTRVPTEIRDVEVVIGIDLGDRKSVFCVLSMASGVVTQRGEFQMTATAVEKLFSAFPHARITLEAGGQSAWVDRELQALGHEVLVANPSRMNFGGRRRRKTDRIDAEQLARIARLDPALLYPIQHRSAQSQADLAVLRGRDILVRTRTNLILSARGMVKVTGRRLASASTAAFARKSRSQLPKELEIALTPLLDTIDDLSTRIRNCDREVERLAKERYPVTSLLMAICGVGALTALAFVLTLETPDRFRNSRLAAAYLGLVPRVYQSGGSDPELRISKAGNGFMRRLLVQSAQHILGPFGKESDLRRFGQRLAGRNGKSAKKRAIVAVARKLAVVMHRLWSRGEVYDADFQAKKEGTLVPTAAAA